MSSVYQRVMSDGQWELTLKPDTPRAVLDQLTAFNVHVVVTPSEIDVGSSDAVFLAAARYVGPVRKLGVNRLNPSGPGNSMWLSDPDGKGEIIETAISSVTGTLSSWVFDLLPTSLTVGTVTSPGGTVSNTYLYVSRRDALNSVCRAFGVEWRVNNDFTVDVGTAAALYRNVAGGDVPAVTVARGFGGRDPQVVGIRSAIETEIDWLDYVTNVIVLGQEVGDAGGLPDFYKPTGVLSEWQRVIVDPTAPVGTSSGVALAIYATLPTSGSGRREVRVSTDVFDPAGDVTLGDDVYVWDPENGLRDTANQVTFQGQLMFPTVMRCVGIKWPVRRGMGVYLRVTNFNPVPPTYLNITNFVEFDDGSAELELSTASKPLRVDQYGNLVTATAPAQQTPWTSYTPTLSGSGGTPTLGNGVITGTYRRDGTTLHVRGKLTRGSSTVFGTTNTTVSLPSGVSAAVDGDQMLNGRAIDNGSGNYSLIPFIAATEGISRDRLAFAYENPTTGALAFLVNGGILATGNAWAAGDSIQWNGTIEVVP